MKKKVCPFCGKEPNELNFNNVSCGTEGCPLYGFHFHINEWNNRYDENTK